MLCAFRLSVVSDPVLETSLSVAAIEGALDVLRLVGADKDELRAGISGGKSIVRTDRDDSDSERDRFLPLRASM